MMILKKQYYLLVTNNIAKKLQICKDISKSYCKISLAYLHKVFNIFVKKVTKMIQKNIKR